MWGALVAAVLAIVAYFAWLTTTDSDWSQVTGILFWLFLLAVPGWPLGRYLWRRFVRRGARSS